jgi:beta-glucosidase/6-phospho-beta-glucosidase/beta-galactosidase
VPRERQSPADFIWGVATSSFQTEGVLDADGRGKFGLVAQDRSTGVRTPKASYAWFSALARSGTLDQ